MQQAPRSVNRHCIPHPEECWLNSRSFGVHESIFPVKKKELTRISQNAIKSRVDQRRECHEHKGSSALIGCSEAKQIIQHLGTMSGRQKLWKNREETCSTGVSDGTIETYSDCDRGDRAPAQYCLPAAGATARLSGRNGTCSSRFVCTFVTVHADG